MDFYVILAEQSIFAVRYAREIEIVLSDVIAPAEVDHKQQAKGRCYTIEQREYTRQSASV
jgi:hypothetical protein